jgi:RimJ/RimL family protein N-acetyltransferase
VIDRLDTARLHLRPLALGDVDALVELDSDPEVMRYTLYGRVSTRAEVEAVVRERIGSRWMGHERATGAFVGWYALIPRDPGEYEIGYRLRRDVWGKGLATEGTRALIDAAFDRLGATRVWAQTMAVNTRSRVVMERCGLRHVRTFHLDWDDPIPGSEHGEVEYEVRRAETEEGGAT